MKNPIKMFWVVFALLSVLSLAVWGAPETSAVSSPKCDEATIRKLCGDALVKIEKAKWEGNLQGFNITLETSKMTFGDLAKKMMAAGCY